MSAWVWSNQQIHATNELFETRAVSGKLNQSHYNANVTPKTKSVKVSMEEQYNALLAISIAKFQTYLCRELWLLR